MNLTNITRFLRSPEDTNAGGGDADSPSTGEIARKLWDDMVAPKPEPTPDKVKQTDVKPEPEPNKDKVVTPELPSLLKKQPTKPEDKPADQASQVPDFDKLTGPDEKSKHRPDWDKMKAAASEQHKARVAAEARVKELEAKLNGAQDPAAAEATKARISELEGRIKEYDAKLKVYDLEAHPEFQKQYVEPQKQAVDALRSIFATEEVTADLDRVLSLEGKAFTKAASELLEELTPFSRTQATNLLSQIKTLQAQRKAAAGNVDQLREQYKQIAAARARQTFDEVTKSFDDTLAALEVPADAAPEAKAEIEQYNAALAAVNATAEKLAFGQVTEKDVASLAHKAARYDFMVTQALPRFEKMVTEQLTKVMGELKAAKDELARRDAVAPGYNKGGSGDAGGDKSGASSAAEGESTAAYAARLAREHGLFAS